MSIDPDLPRESHDGSVADRATAPEAKRSPSPPTPPEAAGERLRESVSVVHPVFSMAALPPDERPREKLAGRGSGSVSDAELLGILFGSGTQGVNAVEMGRRLLDRFGSLRNVSRATREQLVEIPGIGPVKALTLLAVFELGRRLAREPYLRQAVSGPEDVYELLAPEMQALSQESVRVVLLNQRKRLIQAPEVFRGTGNESFANPAEILRQAIAMAAQSIILVHNHPSGDPSPSRADHEVTRRLNAACQAVGIEFTDHIIIGAPSPDNDQPYFSFREAGLI